MRRFAAAGRGQEMVDDLSDLYEIRTRRLGRRRARWLYWRDVVSICVRRSLRAHPLFPDDVPYTITRGPIMLQNYLKVTLRTARRHPVYATIHLAGLAVAVACCLLIFLFVKHEWSYDAFHEKADALYRLTVAQKAPNGDLREVSLTPLPLAGSLRDAYPEVRQAVRFVTGRGVVQRGDDAFSERLVFTDAPLFEVFSFPLVHGTAATALQRPDAVVLAEPLAMKYFGRIDIVGEGLPIDLDGTTRDFVVTGVAAPPPANSSIQFDLLLPLEAYPGYERQVANWGSSNAYTYVQLAPSTDAADLARKLPPFVQQHFAERIQDSRTSGSLSAEEDAWQLRLQPLTDVHLNPSIRWGLQPASNPAYAYILSGIALAVLLIACINFVTLSIARASGRAREVGMRKVMGALPRQLRGQFWGEAFLYSVAAFVLGLALARVLLPVFNDLADRNLSLDAFSQGWALVLIGAGLGLISLLAGSYPALVLARFQPTRVLKGRLQTTSASWLSRTLVVIQFALSIALIISALTMTQQLDFMRTQDLGYDAEQVVVIPTYASNEERGQVVAAYRNALAPNPSVRRVSGVNNSFTQGSMTGSLEVGEVNEKVWFYLVDHAFVATLGLTVIEGRDFSPQHITDEAAAVIVNEAFVQRYGLDMPVGTHLDLGSGASIIGVVQDFHFLSLHNAIEPAVLYLHPTASGGNLLVKIGPDDVSTTLASLEAAWKQVAPNTPFDFYFLDADVQRQYQAEERWSTIVGYAMGLAILIASLGLFGLASLKATERTREIGVRKVLGATTASIAALLSGDFLKPVALGLLLALPLGYFAMHRWLDDFAFRIDISWEIFLMAGLAALGMALLTVSYQSIKAALRNPADALRHE